MFIIVFHHVSVNILQTVDRVIGTIISGGVGNVMKGVLNSLRVLQAILCFSANK